MQNEMDKKEYWFFGSKLNTGLLLVLIVLMIFAIHIMLQNKETYLPEFNQNQTVNNQTQVKDNPVGPDYQPKKLPIALSHCGLNITSPESGSSVSGGSTIGPINIMGFVDNTNYQQDKCSWQMFEGQAGTMQVQFKDNVGWHNLGSSQAVKVENWTSINTALTPITFSFNNSGIGLPSGTLLQIIFTEENASGLPNSDTLILPLVLQ